MKAQPAPDLSAYELQTLSDALLNAAIEEKLTAYIIIAANGAGDFSTSFNIDRASLKKILLGAVEQIDKDTAEAGDDKTQS